MESNSEFFVGFEQNYILFGVLFRLFLCGAKDIQRVTPDICVYIV